MLTKTLAFDKKDFISIDDNYRRDSHDYTDDYVY